MRSLPIPVHPGSLNKIWDHLNVSQADRTVFLAWLLESWRPDTPFPVLELVGEQGSAKSSTQRKARDLIDPNKVSLRGRPANVEDIFVAANNNWVVSFENLSSLPAEQQDALCTLSTGGGNASRQFYTKGEEHVIESKRPVMLNGISCVATRPDLIERAVHIEAPMIPTSARKDEGQLEKAWQRDHAILFGGLLDLFSATLAKLPKIRLKQKQRMADFEMLGEAMCVAQGGASGDFSACYQRKITDGIDRSLESFGVAGAIQAFIVTQPEMKWTGTYLSLYGELDRYASGNKENWPKGARGLSGQLKRLAPALRSRGYEVKSQGHTNKGATLSISFTPAQ